MNLLYQHLLQLLHQDGLLTSIHIRQDANVAAVHTLLTVLAELVLGIVILLDVHVVLVQLDTTLDVHVLTA